jgi:hypothetical protein
MSSCCSSSSRSGTVNTDRFSPSICLHEEEKPANKVKKHIDGESYHDLNLETIATLITILYLPTKSPVLQSIQAWQHRRR